MLEIINAWEIIKEEKKTWLAAAYQFRLPYWDWARKQPYTADFSISQICTQDTWPIIEPGTNGTFVEFENPLRGFINPKKNSKGERMPMGDPSTGPNRITSDQNLPWDKCIGVSRYGVRSDEPESSWVNGVNNWKFSNEAIANPQWYDGHPPPLQSSTFADALSRLVTPGYFTSWETFASTVHNSPRGTKNTNYMSLEYVHNIVQNASGGTYLSSDDIPKSPVGFTDLGVGQTADVPVSNIDRLTALWQVLNWTKLFDKPVTGDPSPDAPLLPFHYDSQGHHWTSSMTQDWRNSNYQYDDLKDMPPGVPTPEYQALLRKHLNSLYLSTSAGVAGTPGLTLSHSAFHDYLINVVYDRYALNGRAYSILFYIGEPTLNFAASKHDPHFVGSVYTFSTPLTITTSTTDDSSNTASCDNCSKQKAAGVRSKAQVPLTLPLVRRAGAIQRGAFGIPATPLGPLDPDRVAQVLDIGLKWYFVEIGGRLADHSEFPNTEIAVLRGEGRHPNEEEGHVMPRYGKYKKLSLATENKPLGYGHEMGPNDLIRDDPDD